MTKAAPSPLLRLLRGDDPQVVPSTGWTAPLTTMVAAAMSFLAVLTLAAGMAADRLANEWRSDLAGVATVRVSADEDAMPGKLKLVLDVLRTTPGIARVEVLSDAAQAALLEPWLGNLEAGLVDLPMPRLIDISLDGDGPDVPALQKRLSLTVDGAIYDDHAAWRAPLAAAANALERLALAATVLIVIAAGAMVALAARATLSANRHVVEVVRLIGAEDSFIANAFIRRLTWRALSGGLIGALIGCAALWLLPSIEADAGLGITLSPAASGWLVLALGVPLISAIIAWATARTTVKLTLRRMI